ncbi:MAG: hypothetical protein ACRCST_05475 [Turicibacter sp.]
MTIIQMLKDAAKGLVLGTTLFYITPEIMNALSVIQNIAATK